MKNKFIVQKILVMCIFFMFSLSMTVFAEEDLIPDLHENLTPAEYGISENNVDSTEEMDSNNKIHFIAIGTNNDAILLESNGRYGMVDSGEKDDRTDQLIGCAPQVIHYLKTHGVEKLDFYIATHAHSDHIGNAESILRSFPTERVYIGRYKDEYIYELKNRWDNQLVHDNLVKAAQETGAEVIQDFDKFNTKFELGNFTIQLYNYERKVDGNGNRVAVWDDNVNSLITVVTLGNNKAVLTGDATPSSYAALPSTLKNVNVLKLAHHGSPNNNPLSFLERMNPQISVQTGPTNLLSQEAYTYLTSDGKQYFSTLADEAAVVVEFPEQGFGNVNAYLEKLPSDFFYQVGEYYYSFDENGRVLKGVQTINTQVYLFDVENGREKFGFNKIDNKTMYLDPDTGCAWREKWYLDEKENYYYFDSNGYALKSGWYEIAGVKYYFDSAGIWIPNAKVEGWQHNSVGWWYRNYNGSYPYNAWRFIGKSYYYFNEGGYMVTGWKNINGSWYYFAESGAMKTGWLKLGNDWYYLNQDGTMQTGWAKIGGYWYFMRSSGKMVTGKQVLGGNYYEFTPGGQWIEPGPGGHWEKNSTGYWWSENNGTWPYNCWKKIEGSWYWFNNYGYRQTGWLKLSDGTYYMDENGRMKTDWLLLNGIWYCFNKSGRMMTGNVIMGDQNKYYFNKAGQLQIGWFEYNGSIVYSDRSGIRLERSGWNLIDEKWYYLDDEEHGIYTGWLIFNEGNENEMCYYLDDEGVMLTGKQVIDGVEYYFSPSGLLQTEADEE